MEEDYEFYKKQVVRFTTNPTDKCSPREREGENGLNAS